MKNLVNYIDYTSLEELQRDEIPAMLDSVKESGCIPATICTWLGHKAHFEAIAQTGAGVSVVLNFSSGRHSIDKVLREINEINSNPFISEVDYVVDYAAWQNRDTGTTKAKLAMLDKYIEKPVKVILETSSFRSVPHTNVKDLRGLAIKALDFQCVKFLKTSTGKHQSGGATLQDAELLLDVITKSHRNDVGLKVSGGIRSIEAAQDYYVLASKAFGENMTPDQFRIGASGLYQKLVNTPMIFSESEIAPELPNMAY